MAEKYIPLSAAIAAAIEGADEWDGGPNITRDTCISDALSALEPADVQPVVRGEWVEMKRKDVNPLTGRSGVYVGCSKCGCPIPTDNALDFIDESEVNICYNCGADMRPEQRKEADNG